MLTWFNKNKTFIIGLLMAIALQAQQYLANGDSVKIPVIVLSLGIAVTGYLARNLRGQWITILGAVGTSLTAVLYSVQNNQPIGWLSVIVALFISILTAAAPAGKSLAYEQSNTIEAAKAEAKVIDSSKQPPVNPPVQSQTPKT